MSLIKKPVTGMKDIMPDEMAVRDYVISKITETYQSFGFTRMETPCVEHIENLCSKQGGDNEKLIFKILKRCLRLSRRCRWATYGAPTALREDATVSSCSAISISWANRESWRRSI